MNDSVFDDDMMDDGTSAFFDNLQGEEPKKGAATGETESPESHLDAKPSEEGDDKSPFDTDVIEDEGAKEPDPDDTEVEWKNGETDTKAKMADLKAAFLAREASASESKAAAAARQDFNHRSTMAQAALGKMLEKAQARWEPYSKLDFLELSRDPSVDAETFKAVREEAAAALEDMRYLSTELQGTVKAQADSSQVSHRAAQAEAVRVLSDPKVGIPGFGPELYGKLIDHAAKTYGAPREALLAVTDPWTIKALHDAMQFRAGTAKAETAAAKMTKVVNTPTRVLRPAGTPTEATTTKDFRSAMSNLRTSGSLDDAASAFEASFRK